MNTEIGLFEGYLSVARCEAKEWFEMGFYKHHYKQEEINKSCKAFLFYFNDEIVGFCSVLTTPRKDSARALGFHRMCVLPTFQRLGIASLMCSFMAAILKNNGHKIYMKCSSPIGEYFNRHPELWKKGLYNGKLRLKNNSEGDKYRNRLESISYCHEYIGESTTGYEELLLPIKDMREKELLYKSKQIKNMDAVINKLNVRTNKVERATNINKPTTYRTMADAMEAARNLPPKKQLFKELWYEGEIGILFSEQGRGKTILAIQIADNLSKYEKVCYLDYELSDQQIYTRYSDRGGEYQFNTNLIRPLRDQIFFKEDQANKLLRYIEMQYYTFGVKIFIIDNITALSHQLESASAMIKLMNKLVELKSKYGLSILILAHTKKRNKKNPIEDNDLAGSKKILALCDCAFTIGAALGDDKALYLKQIKVRECEMKYGSNNVITCHIEKVYNFLQFIEDGYAKEEDLLNKDKGNNKEEIIEMMLAMREGGMSNRAIAKDLNVSEATVRNYMKAVSVPQMAS